MIIALIRLKKGQTTLIFFYLKLVILMCTLKITIKNLWTVQISILSGDQATQIPFFVHCSY